MLGTLVRIIVMALVGVLLGFFAAVSVFADGPAAERAVVIGVTLIGYTLAGWCLGYRSSSWYGFGLAVPGLIVLILYGGDSDNPWWHFAYGVLIVAVAVLGAYGGVRLGMRRTGEASG